MAAPVVMSETDSGVYRKFSIADINRDEVGPLAPGSRPVSTWTETSKPTFKCDAFGLEERIPTLIEANQYGYSVVQQAVKTLTGKMMIHQERAFASQFMKTGVWQADDSSVDWTAADASPVADVWDAKSDFEKNSGVMATDIIISRDVAYMVRESKPLRDRQDQTSSAPINNSDLANWWGVRSVHVMGASYNSAARKSTNTATMTDISSRDLLIVHLPAAPSIDTPAAFYKFCWNPLGMSTLVNVEIIPDRVNLETVVRVTAAWDYKVVAKEAGSFFNDITIA